MLKLLKKSLKDIDNFKLGLFVLSGAHLKYSLRHLQKISPLDTGTENQSPFNDVDHRPSDITASKEEP